MKNILNPIKTVVKNILSFVLQFMFSYTDVLSDTFYCVKIVALCYIHD